MGILLIFGLITLANVGLTAPLDSTANQPPHPAGYVGPKGREFKGQLSQDGAFKVHLTLLAPPAEPAPDRTVSGRQYINKSEERNSDEYIRVQPIKPPSIDPYLIPVIVGTPRQQPNHEDTPRRNKEPSSNLQAVTPRVVGSPFGPVPAGSGLEGQYAPDNHEKQFDDGSDKSKPLPLRLVESPYGPVPVGSGLEGQYKNDNIEKQYDDGSDKAEIVTPRFVNSPYGPAPAGSGLEGQHVPDNLEKLYDDGSDKTPESLRGLYTPDNLEKLYDDGSDKASKSSDSLNSVYDRGIQEPNLEGQHLQGNTEKRFDDGLYRPKGLEKLFDDGLYRPDELAGRFDDGLIKF